MRLLIGYGGAGPRVAGRARVPGDPVTGNRYVHPSAARLTRLSDNGSGWAVETAATRARSVLTDTEDNANARAASWAIVWPASLAAGMNNARFGPCVHGSKIGRKKDSSIYIAIGKGCFLHFWIENSQTIFWDRGI